MQSYPCKLSNTSLSAQTSPIYIPIKISSEEYVHEGNIVTHKALVELGKNIQKKSFRKDEETAYNEQLEELSKSQNVVEPNYVMVMYPKLSEGKRKDMMFELARQNLIMRKIVKYHKQQILKLEKQCNEEKGYTEFAESECDRYIQEIESHEEDMRAMKAEIAMLKYQKSKFKKEINDIKKQYDNCVKEHDEYKNTYCMRINIVTILFIIVIVCILIAYK